MGSRIVLYHVGDEIYNHDYTAYKWCDLVLRNYWSIAFDASPHVMAVPIGYKAGFQSNTPAKPAAQRQHVWSFMGDANKTSRQKMLEELRKIEGGFVHLISGWNSADSLPVEKYRAIMDESIFVPCPAGWGNLDSFRVYEALEAGCIPLVKRRDYDYFTRLLGENPLYAVADWSEVPDMLRHWETGDRWEGRRCECANWWEGYKKTLQMQVAKRVQAI
jgi:hypothetical protein